jgi:hypothetical protein
MNGAEWYFGSMMVIVVCAAATIMWRDWLSYKRGDDDTG